MNNDYAFLNEKRHITRDMCEVCVRKITLKTFTPSKKGQTFGCKVTKKVYGKVCDACAPDFLALSSASNILIDILRALT